MQPEAADIALLRALRALRQDLDGPVPPAPQRDEALEAGAVSRLVNSGYPRGTPPDPELVDLVAALREEPSRVLAAIEDAERAELESPAYRWENVLRRMALLVLAAVALYLYLSGRGPIGKSDSRAPPPVRSRP